MRDQIRIDVEIDGNIEVRLFPNDKKGNEASIKYLEQLAKEQRSLSEDGQRLYRAKVGYEKYNYNEEKFELYAKHQRQVFRLKDKVKREITRTLKITIT